MRSLPLRAILLSAHRYAGLVMAIFLFIASLTGALLAWNDELERLLSPELFIAPVPVGRTAMDPLDLRAKVLEANPNAQAAYQPLRVEAGQALQFFLTPRIDSDGKPLPLVDNQVFIHPYTGALLGSRNANDLWQGRKAFMPFIYRLHYTLTLGVPGALVFGVVAVIWTIDCFVGFYLTLPPRVRNPNPKPLLTRWWPAWKIRPSARGHRLNIDLHRASGLWLWPMLFVIALSSVALSLPTVYQPVIRGLLEHQPDDKSMPRLAQPLWSPPLDWWPAREIGRREMKRLGLRMGFTTGPEEWMFYDASRGLYRYAITSERDIRDRYTNTTLYIDALTGRVKGIWLPTGSAAGDTLTTWLTSLHMAVVGGLFYKAFVSFLGLAVAVLSMTGILIWVKKRNARKTR
ncbi:PepSY-associated TM helix domain-containing protein [Herbaspirillum lusitanum]|uniref:PepSY-associated TM helix domain-containing protein n=1 Tax=Herbaspirillum lusitanum TaxID=213312 RepID=A0ABW9AG88_9BURK